MQPLGAVPRKTKVSFLILWAMLACFAMGRADAGLIAITDPASPGGANNVTQDTATSLDWLDLTASGGISYDDITLQFASGGTYDGWRHATKSEVTTLFTGSAGLTLGNTSGIDPNATQFVALVGITQLSAASNATASRGRYNDDASGTTSNVAGSAFVLYQPSSLIFGPAFTNVILMDDQPVIKSAIPTFGTGHWLVRNVPEPSTLTLAALALLSFTYRRPRRHRPSSQASHVAYDSA